MSTTDVNQDTPAAAPDTGSQLTAENRSVEVDAAMLVYRRFGNEQTDAPPLVCLQHFRGNLDFWDPILVDRIARDREVILLANRGVGASTGVVPDNVTDMARDVLRFVDALGLIQVDLLGFSLGGYISQELAAAAGAADRARRDRAAGRSAYSPVVRRRVPPCVRGRAQRRALPQRFLLRLAGKPG